MEGEKEIIRTSGSGIELWELRERLFQEDNMYRRLEKMAEEQGLAETAKALPYIREKHAGQYRKAGWRSTERVPYIIHPLQMACHASALGIVHDRTLAVILLHDVCEDCGVTPEELPFSEKVRMRVALLTKQPDPNKTKLENTADYYAHLSTDAAASFVKILDRCNNVSTMARSFSREKLIEYIDETELFLLPLITKLRQEYPNYSDAAFVLKYHILAVVESLKCMLMRQL